MDIDFSQFMGMYIDGSKENLDMMDKRLLELEQEPSSQEALNEIFRTAHTLKGMSATMGFDKVAHLTHEMENILDELRNHTIPVTSDTIDVLFETFDILRILVNDSISSTDSGVDLTVVVKKLQQVMSAANGPESGLTGDGSEPGDQGSASAVGTDAETAGAALGTLADAEDLVGIILNEFEMQVLLQAEQSGLKILLLTVVLSPQCLLKAPRAFMVTRSLEELRCDIIKALPDVKDLEDENFDLSFRMLIISPASPEDVHTAIANISEIDMVFLKSAQPGQFASQHAQASVTAGAGGAGGTTVRSRGSKGTRTAGAEPPGTSGRSRTPERSSGAPTTTPSVAGVRGKTATQGSNVAVRGADHAAKSAGKTAPPVSGTTRQVVPAAVNDGAATPKPAPARPAGTPDTGGKPVAIPERRAVQTIRVDMRRLDELMNLVGELVINRTRLQDIGAAHKLKDLNEILARINQISTSLQNVVMQVRMVPIEQVFERFPRMVRDLAKKLNKKINIILEGKETEMDRTVIDEIGDPMVHLIRNSIDHGIEMPAQRVTTGKSETGTIHLAARHEGNSVIIEVRDDGKGVDPAIIGRLAVNRGLFTQEQIDKMPPGEIIKIIFMPGFSTSEMVSDLSGRGVGMDAVKAKLEELNGTLDVESRIGEGTRIIIKLPLTLAILPALMVRLGPETFAIPLGSVQETLDISQQDINIVQHQEVTLLRGEVLPILRLRHLLDVPTSKTEAEKTEELSVVVCTSGEKRGGFMVDELLGQQEIVIKSLGNLLGGLSGIMGATMRGDGRVALILDIPSLLAPKSGSIST